MPESLELTNIFFSLYIQLLDRVDNLDLNYRFIFIKITLQTDLHLKLMTEIPFFPPLPITLIINPRSNPLHHPSLSSLSSPSPKSTPHPLPVILSYASTYLCLVAATTSPSTSTPSFPLRPFSANQSLRYCLSKLCCGWPGVYVSTGQKRLLSGVRTSSRR